MEGECNSYTLICLRSSCSALWFTSLLLAASHRRLPEGGFQLHLTRKKKHICLFPQAASMHQHSFPHHSGTVTHQLMYHDLDVAILTDRCNNFIQNTAHSQRSELARDVRGQQSRQQIALSKTLQAQPLSERELAPSVAYAAWLGPNHHGFKVGLREGVHQLKFKVAHQHTPNRLDLTGKHHAGASASISSMPGQAMHHTSQSCNSSEEQTYGNMSWAGNDCAVLQEEGFQHDMPFPWTHLQQALRSIS